MTNILDITATEALDIDALIADALIQEEAEKAKLEAYADQAKEIIQAEAVRQEQLKVPVVERIYIDGNLKEIADKIEIEQVEAFCERVRAEFVARAAYEKAKNEANDRIQKTLHGCANILASIRGARGMLACDVDPSFINRHHRDNQRFNVYAIEKVGKFVQQMDFGAIGNAINNAIFKTMWNFMNAGDEFTMDAAKCAASADIRLKEEQQRWRKHLVRHTVKSTVASTQSSSTLNAMAVLGIAKQTGMKNGVEVWQMIDGPQTRRIADVLKLV